MIRSPHCLLACIALSGLGSASAAELHLRAVLNGANVVSATDTKATGEASAVLDDDNKLKVNLVFGGLASDVTSASLHTGRSAENGPEATPLEVRKGATDGALVDSQVSVSAEVAQALRDGKAYIVVDTIEHPSGAIRGQLIPQPVTLANTPPGTAQPDTAQDEPEEATP